VSRLPFGIGEPQLRARVRSFGCGRSARAMTHIPVGQSDKVHQSGQFGDPRPFLWCPSAS